MNIATQMMLAPPWRCSSDRSNDKMVDIFVEAGLISCKDVEDAFRAIPRGAFVPNEQFDEAYYDSPLRGDPHVHMSAPHMYATVLEALDLCPGLSFLNIGSGTGYFSCLVGYLIKRNSMNHGIEHYADLVDFCKERCDYFLQHTPTTANEMGQPVFLAGNCFRLDHRDRQYDRIYCGAACPPSKVPFILSMTKVGGFAIIPCKNKLLKIDRVSPTGVKQSVIREVSFASLSPLPNSEVSLPKLKFPPTGDKKKVKTLKVHPPSDLLISKSSSRKTLARLRALQKASECLQSSQPLPLPFCYVPDETQLKVLKASKKIKEISKASNETPTLSAVDSKITFFGSCSGLTDTHKTEDMWDFLNSDKLWENVIEHYYSLCTDAKEDQLKAMNLYTRKKVAKPSTAGRAPSYADLMMKLGLLVDSPSQKPLESKSEVKGDDPMLGSPLEGVTMKKECNSSPSTDKAPSTVASVNESSSTNDTGESEVKPSRQKTVSFNSEEHPNVVDSDTVAQSPVSSAMESSGRSASCPLDCTTPVDSNSSGAIESDSKVSLPTSSRTDYSNDIPNSTTKEPLGACALSADPAENKLDKESCKEAHDKNKISRDRKKSSSCETSRKKSTPEHVDVLIEVDRNCMMKLNTLTKKSWCLEDDKELVRFLSDASDKTGKGRCKGWFKPELTRPSLFSRLDSLSYPRLASISTEDLAFHTVALCRIASILDSCLYLLTGSSLLTDFNTVKPKYPMESFNDLSFESSRNSNNVRFEHLSVEIKREPQESTPFGLMDAEQLRVQFELTSKKLKLTQDLQEQIKEQQKVLRKQASLLEEKQLLIQNLSLVDIHRQSERFQTSEPPHIVVEIKTQRQEVLNRIQKLVDQHASQETKKAELLEELKQVKDDRNRALQLEERKKEAAESPSPPVEQEEPSHPSPTPKKDTKPLSPCTHPRYQLSYLLPHQRFLLPLCRQRWRLVQEMLHASEHSPPDHMPIVTVDRRTPLQERAGQPDASVLLQVFKELRPEGLNYRWNKWKYEQWWEVKFVGEGIIDQGGGFRDSLIEIADEICPPGKNVSEVLPFFIRTPNNKDDTGDYQDTYIPTPLSKQWDVYEWIGKLFGAVYRTDENLTVSCPPFLWKLLVGEHVTWARDYADIDESVVRFTDALEVSDEELYDAAYGVDCKFSTVLSDGTRVDLIAGGENIDVKSSDRQQFARLLREARMTESVKQVLAIRRGLISVVPESVLRLLTWSELERGVCGNPDVSLSVLKSACKYGDDLSESSECIKHFWSALSKFTNDERSRFLRFVTGRRRPPAPFTIVKAGGSNELPNASTCASSLFWPNYPSAAVATARLRYAIYNCIAIDTDTSPW